MASDTHKLLSSVSAVEDNASAKAALVVSQLLHSLDAIMPTHNDSVIAHRTADIAFMAALRSQT